MNRTVKLIVMATVMAIIGCAATGRTEPPSEPKLFRLESPYRQAKHMYRGQIHAHSLRSDGRQEPAEVMAFYRDKGYDFAALSDHLTVTADPGVPGILFLPAIEDNADPAIGRKTYQHLNRVGARFLTPSPHDHPAILETSYREGSFTVINHPNWPGSESNNPGWTDQELLASPRFDAIEIWNASISKSSGRRADTMLTAGRRINLAATDDCHDIRNRTCGTTWLGVFADSLTRENLLDALHRGNYYSSTGAYLSVTASEDTVTVTVPYTSRVEFIGKNGLTLSSSVASGAVSYPVGGDELYVRIRVTELMYGKKAWSNPIYVQQQPASR